MDKIKLIKPTAEYADDIMKYRQELMDFGDSMDGCGNLRQCSSAEEWIRGIEMLNHEETCPKDKVTSDTYIAVRLADNKIVGIIDFRHHIDHPVLGVWGGHIGYSVRPSERKQGYATEMLRQNLQNCKNHGLEKVMITCNSDNVPSEKIIITNGGEFEKEVSVDDKRIKRYWIQL